MITINSKKGDFKQAKTYVTEIQRRMRKFALDKYARQGLNALKQNTPKDTGITASSWSYTIERTNNGYAIVYTNDHVNDGVNVAMIIQLGHATRNGGWVEGIDYINPTLEPIFNKIADDAWKEVVRL